MLIISEHTKTDIDTAMMISTAAAAANHDCENIRRHP